MRDIELYTDIYKKLEELRVLYEDLDDRMQLIEETFRLSQKNVYIEFPRWYKKWLSGEFDA
jgi:hypothetical protein